MADRVKLKLKKNNSTLIMFSLKSVMNFSVKFLSKFSSYFYLLPQKPSEIALGNGISRHLGGVLGIVFN